jgi:hypothetical protein
LPNIPTKWPHERAAAKLFFVDAICDRRIL